MKFTRLQPQMEIFLFCLESVAVFFFSEAAAEPPLKRARTTGGCLGSATSITSQRIWNEMLYETLLNVNKNISFLSVRAVETERIL